MKYIVRTLSIVLVALLIAGNVNVDAKTRRTKKHHKTQTKTQISDKDFIAKLSEQELIELYALSNEYLSKQCPFKCADGVMLQSVSFKDKCVKIVMAYTEDYMRENGKYVVNSDLSNMAYSIMKTYAVNVILELGVSIKTFAKTGIYYDFTIKDDKGNVLGTKKVTNNEIVSAYNDPSFRNDASAGNYCNLELIQEIIKAANKNTPVDTGEGVITTRITMDGTVIYYDGLVVDEFISSSFIAAPKENQRILKDIMARNLYTTFSQSGLFEDMVSLGISFVVRFYKQDEIEPILTINLSAAEIKQQSEL